VRIDVATARDGTIFYGREPLTHDAPRTHETTIVVTEETTAAAARRLGDDVALLNFASARNVGGGFLNGARAQEEDLCRKSALYPCIERARAYYDANRREPSALYTDHMIWSPHVPFFRDEDLALVSNPTVAAVLTAPAPNAGALRKDDERRLLRETFVRRIDRALTVFAKHGHTRIVLGAWGCGAFGLDPEMMAGIFREALLGTYRGVFDEIVFAITDWSPDERFIGPFRRAFSDPAHARL
jgi:uncharacterized protein (TIGR02452 family)